MSEAPTSDRLRVRTIAIAIVSLVIVLAMATVGIVTILKRPPIVTVAITGTEGRWLFGTIKVDEKSLNVACQIPKTFTYQANSVSYILVPAKSMGEGTEIHVVFSEEKESQASSSSIYGVKGEFVRYFGGQNMRIDGVTPEERDEELAKHDRYYRRSVP